MALFRIRVKKKFRDRTKIALKQKVFQKTKNADECSYIEEATAKILRKTNKFPVTWNSEKAILSLVFRERKKQTNSGSKK